MERASLRLLLLLACVGQACMFRACDKDCDPKVEDCSLSPTCCSPPSSPTPPPPARISVRCDVDSGSGMASFALIVWIRDGQPPFRWTVDFGDNQSATGTNPGVVFANGEVRERVDHRYPELPGQEPVVYPVRATVTDARNESASCSATHGVDPQLIDIDCNVAPRTGAVPLTVTFDARTSGCIGNCTVVWDFGDGESATGRHVEHTYQRQGLGVQSAFPARGTVTDSEGRSQYCPRPVQVVLSGDPTPVPSPSPSPSPSASPSTLPNHPPVIANLTVTPSKFPAGGSTQVTATITDVDPGDTITWSLTLVAGSTVTGTFAPASSTGGTVSSTFTAATTAQGPAQVRLTAVDSQAASTQATANIYVFVSN